MASVFLRVGALFLVSVCYSFSANLVFNGIATDLGMGTALGSGANSSLWSQQDGSNFNAYWIGGMSVSVNGVSRVVFCVDAFTDIYIGSTNTSTLTAPSTAQMERAAWLLNTEHANLTETHSGVSSNQLGAALQLALWDITMDNGNGLTAGRIQKSSSGFHPTDAVVLQYANQFIAESVGHVSTNAIVYNNVCISGAPSGSCGTQSQTLLGIVINDGGPQVPTPEPSTISLCMIAGLAGILVQRGRGRASL